jgi:hypothetical protein
MTPPVVCPTLDNEEHISLCETLDRVLNKGIVVAGEVVISVADIDLIYLNLQLMLTSVETACRYKEQPATIVTSAQEIGPCPA